MARRQTDPDELHEWFERQRTEEHYREEASEREARFDPTPALELLRAADYHRFLKQAERDQRLIDATNADNECPHGHLPTDPGLTCDCWDQHEDAHRTVALEPFQERFRALEPKPRLQPGNDPQDAATALAVRLGWFACGVPDGQRVRRTLGLRASPATVSNGKHYPPSYRQRIHRRTALQLCEAMGMDPAEVDL